MNRERVLDDEEDDYPSPYYIAGHYTFTFDGKY
jgi:hypothetical protein